MPQKGDVFLWIEVLSATETPRLKDFNTKVADAWLNVTLKVRVYFMSADYGLFFWQGDCSRTRHCDGGWSWVNRNSVLVSFGNITVVVTIREPRREADVPREETISIFIFILCRKRCWSGRTMGSGSAGWGTWQE